MIEKLKEFKKRCSKNHEDHMKDIWLVRILRNVSVFITRIVTLTPLKPNHITSINLFLGIIVALFFLTSNLKYNIIGIILFYVWILLDLVDGEVARYKQIYSNAGLFLDIIAYYIMFAAVFIAISINVYNNTGNIFYLYLGMSYVIIYLLYRIMIYSKSDILIEKLDQRKLEDLKANKPQEFNGGFIKRIIRFGFIFASQLLGWQVSYNLMFLMILLNRLDIYLIFYGIFTPLYFIAQLLFNYFMGVDLFIEKGSQEIYSKIKNKE
jgi:phosphatidylglycerophosphate synthase